MRIRLGVPCSLVVSGVVPVRAAAVVFEPPVASRRPQKAPVRLASELRQRSSTAPDHQVRTHPDPARRLSSNHRERLRCHPWTNFAAAAAVAAAAVAAVAGAVESPECVLGPRDGWPAESDQAELLTAHWPADPTW